jgi:hypothetical protein
MGSLPYSASTIESFKRVAKPIYAHDHCLAMLSTIIVSDCGILVISKGCNSTIAAGIEDCREHGLMSIKQIGRFALALKACARLDLRSPDRIIHRFYFRYNAAKARIVLAFRDSNLIFFRADAWSYAVTNLVTPAVSGSCEMDVRCRSFLPFKTATKCGVF